MLKRVAWRQITSNKSQLNILCRCSYAALNFIYIEFTRRSVHDRRDNKNDFFSIFKLNLFSSAYHQLGVCVCVLRAETIFSIDGKSTDSIHSLNVSIYIKSESDVFLFLVFFHYICLSMSIKNHTSSSV